MSGAIVTWIDGAAGEFVPVDDRGLQYGDGIFETILVRDGNARFLDLHRDRMHRGLTRLGIRFDANQELSAEIARAVSLAPPLAVLKIIVTRGSALRRGYAPAGNPQARRIVSLWSTAPLERKKIEQGVSVEVARLRLPEMSPFAGIKHLNRLENVLAAAEILGDPSAFDCLMLDSAERVISGSSCNVFLVAQGELLTPPVNRIGVAGVMRAIVLREAQRLGYVAREHELTLQDVWRADAMFITNARIGVVPVRNVREHAFAMNHVVERLVAHIETLDA